MALKIFLIMQLNKEWKMQFHSCYSLLIILFFAGLPLRGWASSPSEITENKYDIYFGDFNGDGVDGDIYFHPKPTFVLIHSSIAIPIFIPDTGGFAYYAEGDDKPHSLVLDEATLSQLTPAVSGRDYFYLDQNNDGYLDIFINLPDVSNGYMVISGSSDAGLPSIIISLPEINTGTHEYDTLGQDCPSE